MRTTDGTRGSFALAGGLLAGFLLSTGIQVKHLSADPSMSGTTRFAEDPAGEVLAQTERLFESVARVVSPAVVYIEARHRDVERKTVDEESGSGVVVRPSPEFGPVIVTNLHVVVDAKPTDIDVYLGDGRVIHPTRVLIDEDTDLAILLPGASDLPAAKLGDSDKSVVGQWVLALGSPFGLTQSVTHGIISARDRRQIGLPGPMRIKEFLQTDAAINPGNSGGPLVDLRGEVIGINTAIASRTGSSSGVGFSIPVNLVKWVVSELLAHGRVRRAFLGVQFPNRFDSSRAQALGLTLPVGALVKYVHSGTPAANAGLRVDDVILEFDGRPISDDNHLINMVSSTPIGKKVTLVVWRDRRRVSVATTLSSWDTYQEHVSRGAPPERLPAIPVPPAQLGITP